VTVRYTDVRAGRDHEAAAYLRPPALERFGDVVAFAVEIGSGGKVLVEQEQHEGALTLPARWWRDRTVAENSALVVAREGYLVDRAHSPFALVHIDDQEAIRQ
jgi:hypothetical protein